MLLLMMKGSLLRHRCDIIGMWLTPCEFGVIRKCADSTINYYGNRTTEERCAIQLLIIIVGAASAEILQSVGENLKVLQKICRVFQKICMYCKKSAGVECCRKSAGIAENLQGVAENL